MRNRDSRAPGDRRRRRVIDLDNFAVTQLTGGIRARDRSGLLDEDGD
jgi:hypothetical protein